MLKRLENIYLAILRFVVIIASGLLLVAVILSGIAAIKGFTEPNIDELAPPKVNSDELIKDITEQNAEPVPPQVRKQGPDQSKESADPNLAYYEAAALKIANFISIHSNRKENVDKEQIINIIKNRAESYDPSDELTAAFAKEFSEATDKVLSDKAVEDFAKKSSTIDVVNKLLNLFTEEFAIQVQAERERIKAAHQEHMMDEEGALESLYISAGSFGAFLIIVFLSIFIKIERNLRHLEKIGQGTN